LRKRGIRGWPRSSNEGGSGEGKDLWLFSTNSKKITRRNEARVA